jgi:group I intron endonuclease
MKSGVYQIRNLTNNRRYIGSATDLKDRWRCHRRDANAQTHHSVVLQRAWNKYGADAFVFEVLLYCDPKDCLMYEQIAFDHYKPEYNICKMAGSSLGAKWREESKQKRRGSGHPMYGKHHSQSARTSIGMASSLRHGGSDNPAAKLTEDMVVQIKHLMTNGVGNTTIATQFNVTESTIRSIKTGRTWSHVTV